MRICVLAHNLKDDNGTGVFSSRLIKGLEKDLEAEVVALTTEKSGFAVEEVILSHNILKFLIAFPRVRRIAKSCDVLHAMDAYPYGIIATLANIGLNKKIIVTAIGTGSVGFLYNKHWLFTRLTAWSYKRASAITAISRFTRGLILARLPSLEIEVINPGVDYKKFAKKNDAEKNKEIESLRPYVLSVGAIRWRKGYKRSIRAFAKVREKFPQMKYVIVGRKYPGPYYEKLEGIIRELHLENSVVLLDKVNSEEELAKFYQGAEVFCLLSQNYSYDVEGFGIVFLEAAAAGLPVIGGNESGIEDAVQDGKNGFLVDWNDAKGELAEKLIQILGDKELRARMSAASIEWAKRSTWENRIGEYVNLYRKIA